MKINIISDIHATINDKNEVIYDILPDANKGKFIEAMNILLDSWIKNENKVKNIDYSVLSERLGRTIIKNYDDGKKLLEELVSISDFSLMSDDKLKDYVALLNDIRHVFAIADVEWNYKKTVITIYGIIDWLYMNKSVFYPDRLETADYLIVAGDLGIANCYDFVVDDLKKQTKEKFKDIMHIAGNHDHWWIGNSKNNEKKPDKVDLSHDYYEKEDGEYLFLGCTLWTPIKDNSIHYIGRYMNDYRYAPNFSPYASREQYRLQSKWLKEKIEANKDKKIVVFTHHQPFEELIANDYKHNGYEDGICVNEAYAVMDHSLDDINKYGNIKLWCCGHTHQCFDGMLHDVHVVRNPIGYRTLYNFYSAENMSGTWYNKIIEI